ncbi:hypothetical protein ADK86_36830 [Streptomyces sp. NRRL F-5755]|uniref:hypothetical protein n=1 Tax=Streptomyces sp. NRRL F-5755 TaxID=1519475 RepID=UPI0006AF3C24|nr:hypothetical protein [Streptomyces sp. NRRL F-5755]KOT87236.1 hypothetical protein ADK86_36830 [Streptomyces sp. NRRL F-5755]
MDSTVKRPSEPAGQRAAVSHVAPADRDLAYDADAGQIRLPVTVHFTDGTTEETVLRLGPGRAELLAIQIEQAIAQRTKAQRAMPE